MGVERVHIPGDKEVINSNRARRYIRSDQWGGLRGSEQVDVGDKVEGTALKETEVDEEEDEAKQGIRLVYACEEEKC